MHRICTHSLKFLTMSLKWSVKLFLPFFFSPDADTLIWLRIVGYIFGWILFFQMVLHSAAPDTRIPLENLSQLHSWQVIQEEAETEFFMESN